MLPKSSSSVIKWISWDIKEDKEVKHEKNNNRKKKGEELRERERSDIHGNLHD